MRIKWKRTHRIIFWLAVFVATAFVLLTRVLPMRSQPIIVRTVPEDGAVLFPLDKEFSITFDKPLSNDTYIQNITVFDDRTQRRLPLSVTTYSDNRTNLAIDNSLLHCGEHYILDIETKRENKHITFTTEECNWIVSSAPSHNQKNVDVQPHIQLYFKKNLPPDVPYADHLTVRNQAGQTIRFTFVAETNVLTIIPSNPLDPASKYSIAVSARLYKLLNQADFAQEDYRFEFITKLQLMKNVDVYSANRVGEIVKTYQWYVNRFESIGKSVRGKDIYLVGFGAGKKKVLIVGGHHGYEEESIWVPLQLIHYVARNENFLPKDIEIWIIPLLNPDGFDKLTRENAHAVDLNRNYNHPLWASTQKDIFYSGEKPFSEPETAAIKELFNRNHFDLVISYHSIQSWVSTNSFLDKYPNLNRVVSLVSRQQGYDFLDTTGVASDKGTIGDFVTWADAYYHTPGVTIEVKKESSSISLEKNIPILRALFDWIVAH